MKLDEMCYGLYKAKHQRHQRHQRHDDKYKSSNHKATRAPQPFRHAHVGYKKEKCPQIWPDTNVTQYMIPKFKNQF